MGLLSPLYLLGAAAIAAPIIFHLTRQTPKERVPFSSTMFLEETPVRVKKRNKLEHLFLLLLRCLALLLIVLAFSRPFMSGPEDGVANRAPSQVVLLIDSSASMQREGLQSALVTAVLERVSELKPHDQVAAFSFNATVTPLFEFGQWAERGVDGLMQAIEADRTLSGGTAMGRALIHMAESMDDQLDEINTTGPRKILVFTDAQQGMDYDALHAFEWAQEVAIEMIPLETSHPGNASLHLVSSPTAQQNNVESTADSTWIRVNNSADAAEEHFTVKWSNHPQPTISVHVPAGQSKVIRAPATLDGIPADSLELVGDAARFDNLLFIAPVVERRVNILFIGEHTENNPDIPFYFFSRAMLDTHTFTPVITTRASSEDLTGIDPDAIDFCVVATPIHSPEMQSLLQQFTAKGGSVFHLLLEKDNGALIRALTQDDDLKVKEAAIEDFALFSHLDLKHPLLRIFDDPEFGDFSGIHVWHHRIVQHSNGTVLARFDGQAPALIEWPAGNGRVIVMTTGWQPDDSQLALSSRFIPLLFSMLEYTGSITQGKTAQFDVGAAIPIPERIDQVFTPDDRIINLEKNQQLFTQTSQTGLYRFRGNGQELPFAVNHPAEESRTVPGDLAALHDATHPPIAETADLNASALSAHATAEEQEGRQKLWRWLIMGVWAALLIETGMASRAPKLQASS